MGPWIERWLSIRPATSHVRRNNPGHRRARWRGRVRSPRVAFGQRIEQRIHVGDSAACSAKGKNAPDIPPPLRPQPHQPRRCLEWQQRYASLTSQKCTSAAFSLSIIPLRRCRSSASAIELSGVVRLAENVAGTVLRVAVYIACPSARRGSPRPAAAVPTNSSISWLKRRQSVLFQHPQQRRTARQRSLPDRRSATGSQFGQQRVSTPRNGCRPN